MDAADWRLAAFVAGIVVTILTICAIKWYLDKVNSHLARAGQVAPPPVDAQRSEYHRRFAGNARKRYESVAAESQGLREAIYLPFFGWLLCRQLKKALRGKLLSLPILPAVTEGGYGSSDAQSGDIVVLEEMSLSRCLDLLPEAIAEAKPAGEVVLESHRGVTVESKLALRRIDEDCIQVYYLYEQGHT